MDPTDRAIKGFYCIPIEFSAKIKLLFQVAFLCYSYHFSLRSTGLVVFAACGSISLSLVLVDTL